MNLQSTEVTGNETDFTPARHSRRKAEQQRSTGSSMRSNDGRAMSGSKIREVRNADVAKEVMVSNRFGSLGEEEVTEVGRLEWNACGSNGLWCNGEQRKPVVYSSGL
ncbi:hypothetical protein IGI04_029884 [Brassica rapa subsp. trilocularis]|uniref:Leucine-rich repeat-containing N-terminal plant-type domain-containing protein n=1 Tax=Brassica rapa subsp. trilocularis TaxID=1813537 RepID=A0ABQ7LP55_BRACM|nr:hypothetical protein IGI04_029884 [Brassica rapa subsp. trilocularis]